MRNPWVIAICIFSFVAVVGLMVAAAVGLEAVQSDDTDVLLPALIAFGGVSLTLLASTLIPTLIKAGSTEAAAQKAADASEETKQIIEEVRHEVNGNLTKRLKALFSPLEHRLNGIDQRLERGDRQFEQIGEKFGEFSELVDAMRAEMAAMHGTINTLTSCDVQPTTPPKDGKR